MVTTRRKHKQDNRSGNSPDPIDSFSLSEEKPLKKRRVAPTKSSSSRSQQATTTNATKRLPARTFFEVIPSDIVFDVFALLQPLDLLHLSRTNKTIRAALMTKSSASVWRAARLNVPTVLTFPECPTDQSEPQWARLLFDQSCTICCAPNVDVIDWVFRLRLCTACYKRRLITRGKAMKLYRDVPGIEQILRMLPHSNGGWKPWITEDISEYAVYHADRIPKMIERYRSYELGTSSLTLERGPMLQAFSDAGRAEACEIMENEDTFLRWESERRAAEAKLHEERLAAIQNELKDRLLALGHELTDISCALWNWRSIESLADKEWLNLRPKLESAVERNKAERLIRERKYYLENRKRKFHSDYTAFFAQAEQKLPFLNFAPSCNIFLKIRPAIKELVEAEGDASFTQVLNDILPDALEEWRTSRKEEFLSLLPTSGVFSPPEPKEQDVDLDARFEIFKLAKCAFYCATSRPSRDGFHGENAVFFDRSLTYHSCKTRQDPQTCYCDASESEPGFSCLKFSPSASEAVDAVCKAVEMDSSCTTIASLDQLDARFKCLDCPERTPKIRSWRIAIIHRHPKGNRPQFERLSSKQEDIIKSLETRQDPQPRIICKLCGRRWSSFEIDDHLDTAHREEGLTPANHEFDPIRPPLPIAASELDRRR